MDKRTLQFLGIIALAADLVIGGLGAHRIATNLPVSDEEAMAEARRAFLPEGGATPSRTGESVRGDVELRVWESAMEIRNTIRAKNRSAGSVYFVFGFIWRVASPALNEMLENRQKRIKDDLEAAQAEKAEAAALKEDYAAQLAGAREEATRIVEDARQAGESARADIVARAEGEAEDIKERAQQELEAERERTMTAMRREVAGLSLDVAEKLVGHNLDRAGQQALVDQFIDELGDSED